MMIGDIAHRLRYAEIKKDRAAIDEALNYVFDYIQKIVGEWYVQWIVW